MRAAAMHLALLIVPAVVIALAIAALNLGWVAP